MSAKLLKDLSYDELVEKANKTAEQLVKSKAKTSQLRKFHSHITRIWEMARSKKSKVETLKNQVVMLKPMIHYTDARFQGKYEVLRKIINDFVDDMIRSKDEEFIDKLKKFKDFYDSLIAYFVYYEKQGRRGGRRG